MSEQVVVVRGRSLPVPLFATILCMLAGCSTMQTGAHLDETNSFGAYRTFSWIDEDPLVVASDGSGAGMPVDPLTKTKIQRAIRAEFENTGYRFVEERDSADFVVAYTVGSREQISIDSYPELYRGAWGWHVRGSYFYAREFRAHSYTRGTLAIDVFDNTTKQPVWHGWAEKTVTTADRRDPGPAIEEAVRRLVESFPR